MALFPLSDEKSVTGGLFGQGNLNKRGIPASKARNLRLFMVEVYLFVHFVPYGTVFLLRKSIEILKMIDFSYKVGDKKRKPILTNGLL